MFTLQLLLLALCSTVYLIYSRHDTPSLPPLPPDLPKGLDLLQTSIEELNGFLNNRTLTSVQLVSAYLKNIERDDHKGLGLGAVIQTAPPESVFAIALGLDDERAAGHLRGPLHGIPILVKDSIATDVSLGMATSAGNFALKEGRVKRDAEVIRKLREAGAIILGKTNLNEFSGGKGRFTSRGGAVHVAWSAVGGQTYSAYVGDRSEATVGIPGGSSSGSAVAVSAGFAAAALGGDTTGSVIQPASRAALVGIRPSKGLVSIQGAVPLTTQLDAIGPMALNVADAARLLDAMSHNDGRFLDAAIHPGPLSQFRLGLVRNNFLDEADGRSILPHSCVKDIEPVMKHTARRIAQAGATVLDVNTRLTFADIGKFSDALGTVQVTDLQTDLNAYLADLDSSPVRTLHELIVWNEKHARLELPESNCCQEMLIDALVAPNRTSETYKRAWKTVKDYDGEKGFGYVLREHDLDGLVFAVDLGSAPAFASAWNYAEGTAPMGYCENGLPFGILFLVRPGEEEKLFRILAGYEAIMPPRRVPEALRRR